MPDPLTRRATYEDIVRAPDHMVAEIADGELYLSPRPASRHSLSSSRLGGELVPPFDRGRGGPGGWWILDEPELHLGENVLVPDMAGWRRERMPELPDVVGFEFPPDWACEVLSPSTARLDRIRKMPIYADYAVPILWLVDPTLRTLEVFELQNGRWSVAAMHEGDVVVRVLPFDAIELELAALWLTPTS